ncbi:hypothetical protein FRB99_002700 [Tulasnella sp. 403]|nr:hypothetical protein FRB99_002700 [Tulasnella sp. 403]
MSHHPSSHPKIKPGIPEHLLKRSRARLEEDDDDDSSNSSPRGPDERSGRRLRPQPKYQIPNDQAEEDENFQPFGESDAPISSSGRRKKLPARVLRHFTIFDARDNNALVSLSRLARPPPNGGIYVFRAAGMAYHHASDFDPEDDDDENIDLGVPVTLSPLLAMHAEYGSDDGLGIWVITKFAWYKLELPSPEYLLYYSAFWKRHLLIHTAVRAVIEDQETGVDVMELLQRTPSPSDAVLRKFKWTEQEVNDLIGHLGPELSIFASDRFPSIPERDRFLRNPLITKLIGTWDGKVSATQGSTGIVADKPKTIRSGAPPVHMMPITGYIAKQMFNARFKIHGSFPNRETPEEKSRMKREAQRFLEDRQQRPEVETVETSGQVDRKQSANSVTVAGVGTFRVNYYAFPSVPSSHTALNSQVGDFALIAPLLDEKGTFPPEMDSAFVSPNSIVNKYSFVQIHQFYHVKSGWRFHGRILTPACHTILQEAGHSRELFADRICGDFRVGMLVRRLDVKVVRPEEQFVEPMDGRCDSLRFFLRYRVTPDGSFHSLNPEVFTSAPKQAFGCVCQSALIQQRENTEPALAKAAPLPQNVGRHRETDSRSPYILHFRGEAYRVNDFVFVARPASEKGVFRIGQIVSLKQWHVRVRILGRHEDLARQDNEMLGESNYIYSDVLYLTHEEKSIPVDDIISICHVRHDEELTTPEALALWADLDGFRLAHQLDPNQSMRDLTLKSLRPLPLEDYTPSSKEMRKQEDDEMRRIAEFRRTNSRTCYDMFHGAGGLTMGFSRLGWKVVGGIDKDSDATATVFWLLRMRYPNARIHTMDGRELLKEMLKDRTGTVHPQPGTVDLFLSGPPCQDFTGLNRFKAKDDNKKALVANAVTIVEHLRPNWVVMENVTTLLNGRLKPVISERQGEIEVKEIRYGVHKYVLRGLTALGYNVQWKIYESANFGVPQSRERLIYVAAKRHLPLPADLKPTHVRLPFVETKRFRLHLMDIPKDDDFHTDVRGAPHYAYTARDAVSDLPPFDWALPPADQRVCAETPESRKKWRRHRDAGIPEFSSETASREENLLQHWEWKVDRDDAMIGPGYATPPRNDLQNLLRRGYEGPLRQHITKYFCSINVERIHAIGLGKNADHRSLPPPLQLHGLNSIYSVGAPVHNYFPGLFARVQYDEYFQTVVANIKPSNKYGPHTYLYIVNLLTSPSCPTRQGRCLHPTQMRVLSVRECARAQGFPDDMIFCSSDDDPVDMHRQIGNAVPVALAEALARELRRTIIHNPETSQRGRAAVPAPPVEISDTDDSQSSGG